MIFRDGRIALVASLVVTLLSPPPSVHGQAANSGAMAIVPQPNASAEAPQLPAAGEESAGKASQLSYVSHAWRPSGRRVGPGLRPTNSYRRLERNAQLERHPPLILGIGF